MRARLPSARTDSLAFAGGAAGFLRSTILVATTLLAACTPANTLQGSLEDEVSLTFSSVQVQASGSEVSVAYLNPAPGGSGGTGDAGAGSASDIIIEIAASTTGVDLTNGGTLNLLDKLPDGSSRGAVTRAVANDPRRDFAPLTRGTLVFTENPTVGAKVTGTFSLLFDASSSDLGAGRTVYGSFAATVQSPDSM